MIIVGNKIYDYCKCGKLVQLNKFFFGSLHICEDKVEKRRREIELNKIKQQEQFNELFKKITNYNQNKDL